METKLPVKKGSDSLNVLLIGNNPIDMSNILTKLNQIRGKKIITEIAFDVRSIMERLVRFKPNFILIDDNVGKSVLTETVDTLSQRAGTKHIPIAVLKNSNYQEAYSGRTILDYILKTNLSPESLYNTLKNSLRFRKTQLFLYKAYNKRKQALKKFYAA